MNGGEIFVSALVGLALASAIGCLLWTYNGLVSLGIEVRRCWANLDMALLRRHEQLPELARIWEGRVLGDRLVREHLDQIRRDLAEAYTVGERARVEGRLSRTLEMLAVAGEARPEPARGGSQARIRSRLADLENQISDRCVLYNETVMIFNARMRRMPGRLVARWLSLTPAEPFAAEPDDDEIEDSLAMAS